MRLNWLGSISAVLGVMAFQVVYQAVKNRSITTRVICSILAVLCALLGLSFTVYYAHWLPEANWYYQFRSVNGMEWVMVFLGVAGGLVATLLPRNLLVVPLFAALVLSLAPFAKPMIGPIPDGEFKNHWDGDVCLQSTPSTCGAASTATILKFLGDRDPSESKVAAAAHSYAGGTEAW